LSSSSIILMIMMIMMMFDSAEKNRDFTSDIRSDFSLDDLNFDPAALIGDNNGDWSVSPFNCLLSNSFQSQKLYRLFFGSCVGNLSPAYWGLGTL